MASRKEEKERLRKERLEAEKQQAGADRKRLVLGYLVAGILGVAVIGGVIFAVAGGGGDDGTGGDGGGDGGSNVNTTFGIVPNGVEVDNREGAPPPEVVNGELSVAAEEAGCDLQLDLKDEGNNHLDQGDDLPDYGTAPPTSGDHYLDPLADGAFATTPPIGNAIHGLEHGRIEVQYNPDLPENQQLELKGVFDADRPGMIFFPNEEVSGDLAVTAWTQMMTCDTYEGAATLDAVRAFRDAYRGRGPEPIDF